MVMQANMAGVWSPPKAVFVRRGGVWVPAQYAHLRRAGAWTAVYTAEVVVTLATRSTSVDIRSLFDTTTWSDTKRKRVIVPASATINADNWAGALYVGSGAQWGGELIVDNYGTLAGIGGVSWSNGGEGGSGISCAITGLLGQRLTVNNYGNLYGGGGAGGQGGQGGGGVYQYVASNQEWPGLSWGCYWLTGVPGDCPVGWMFNTVANAGDVNSTAVWGNDGALYLRGSLVQGTDDTGYTYYGVSRQTFANAYTSGGYGGAGGRGQGSDGVASAGAGGGSPGTNAGWGGQGGTGGSWGAYGGAGLTGNSGNNGGGAPGAGGGPGGRYAWGWLTFNNMGAIAGRLALS